MGFGSGLSDRHKFVGIKFDVVKVQ